MKILISPFLLITYLFISGFVQGQKIRALYCDNPEYFIDDPIKQWDWFPWIFDQKTGALYNYDSFFEEATPLLTDKVDDSIFTYRSKMDGNLLKIKEKQINSKGESHVIYQINIKTLEAHSEHKGKKTQLKCVEKKLPKDIKIFE